MANLKDQAAHFVSYFGSETAMPGNGIIGISATIFSSPVKGLTLSHNRQAFLLLHADHSHKSC